MVHEQEYLKRIAAHLWVIKWTFLIFCTLSFTVGFPVRFWLETDFMGTRTVQSYESNYQTKQVSSSSVSSSSTRKLAANIERPKSINVTGSMLDH